MPAEQLEFARSLRANQTDAENLMWALLRDRRLADAKFRRQHPMGKYVLDFYCHEAKLAIELDGSQHLDSAHDATRDEYLHQQGIRVLRYWNNDVLVNTDSVLEDIWNVLQALLPSPLGGRARDEGNIENEGNVTLSPQPSPGGRGSDYLSPIGGRQGVRVAFVSTNSITQGEQVGVLWGWMLAQGIHIHFAHRTFSWNNEARGKAAVHCVIIGFYIPSPLFSPSPLAPLPVGEGNNSTPPLTPLPVGEGGRRSGEGELQKTIYEYEDIKGEPHAIKASNINPYLVDAPDLILDKTRRPICNVPEMTYGSKPADGGFLILTAVEKADLIKQEPSASEFIRPYIGSEELIKGGGRFCLWLKGVSPQTLRAMPPVMQRIEQVRQMRLASTDKNTQNWASLPAEFQTDRQPKTDYLAVPEVSSERRAYLPIAYLGANIVASNLLYTIENANLFHFGVLTSIMHNAWVRAVCGRLESRYRYSAGIVYNNFPWPALPSPPTPLPVGEGSESCSSSSPLPAGEGGQRPGEGKNRNAHYSAIEACAQAVLDARTAHPNASLADLYDPLTMPANLLKAHQALDKAVDAAYGYKGAQTDAARVAFLFELYQKLTSLLPAEKARKTRKK